MDNNTHPIDVKLCPPRQTADACGGQSTNHRMCVAALLAATLRGWMNASRPADSHVTVQVGRGRGAWDPRWQAERNETAAEPSFCRRDSPSGRTLRPGSRLLHSLTVSPALASALNLRSGGTAARMRMGKSLSARSFARLGPTRHSARAVAVCLLVGETRTAAGEQESSAVQQRQAEDETRQLKQDR